MKRVPPSLISKVSAGASLAVCKAALRQRAIRGHLMDTELDGS
jgi:hypothetical protein